MAALDDEVTSVLGGLTLEEKVGILSGGGFWQTNGVPRVGLPPLRMSDGPHGPRGMSLSGDCGALLAPCELAMAATFDEALIEEVCGLLGSETRRRGIHVLLGPCLNLQRWPLCGRHFECFSEDPFLAGRMGVAWIRGVQRHVAACAKHFVCNDQEDYRHTLNSVVDQQALHEVYLLPFEAAVREADVDSIMCGYNRLNGTYCAENEWALQTVLRGEWGFKGWVVSDWFGNQSTVASLQAGLNVEMPGVEPRHFGGYLLDAVRRGAVDETLVDERCRPVLRTLLRLKGCPEPGADASLHPETAAELLRRAAASACVLLKNQNDTLPLKPSSLKRVLVVGPNAEATTVQGGGSCRVHPKQCLTILEALRNALPADVEIVHKPGCSAYEKRDTSAELEALKMLGSSNAAGQHGSLRMQAQVSDVFLSVAAGFSKREWFRRWLMPILRMCGVRQPDPAETARKLAREHAAKKRNTQQNSESGSETASFHGQRCRSDTVNDAMLASAEEAAADVDACVLVVGTDGHWESEGQDQPHMRLPGRQNELVERVAAKLEGRPLVVVLNVGSPKEMPWLDQVPAIVLAHFGGQEMSSAVIDVLLGACSPAGRLPTTWPKLLEDSPAVATASSEPRPGEAVYSEGVNVGHRSFSANVVEPQFPFGHGLSYTSFVYSDFRAELLSNADGGPQATASVQVRNSGTRDGAEVLQVYTQTSGLPRSLGAFARTKVLQPGEEVQVTLQLGPRALGSRYNVEAGRWESPAAGTAVSLEVGSSSATIHGSASLVVR